MAEVKDKIKHGLGEARILILGAQVLVGFQFTVILEKRFADLPRVAQDLKLGALVLMLGSIALLMSPTAYHQIAERGAETKRLHRFITVVMAIALLPFAVGLGIDLYVAGLRMGGQWLGITLGLIAGATALALWYGWELAQRARHADRRGDDTMQQQRMQQQEQGPDGDGAKLKDKVEAVLSEAKMILPGAQALLGFQMAGMLTEGFEKLPRSSQWVHLAGLGLIAVAVVLLMAPAAYHRIVEEGEDSQHFYRVAGRLLLAAMVPLALGICAELYVVARKVTHSQDIALALAAVALLFFYGLWFGYTALNRRARPAERTPQLSGARATR